MQTDRLKMPIGEAMFTQRSVRKLRTDPIPMEDLHLLIEAAVKAPNGGNNQVGRFLIVSDRAKIREFGALYKEAWWAKRWDDHKWTKPEDIPLTDKNHRSAMGLSEDMKDVPCVIFAFTARGGGANSVIPACQNLMLAAHALGIGISHGPTDERFGIKPGKPLEDMRQFVQDVKASAKLAGELPPITLATLRKRMTALSAEIAQGAVWANAARSHMPESLKALPDVARTGSDFFIGYM